MLVLQKAVALSDSCHSDAYARVLLRGIGFSVEERERARDDAHVVLLSVLDDSPMSVPTLDILFGAFLREEDAFAVEALNTYCIVRKTRVDAHNSEDPGREEDPRMEEIYNEFDDAGEEFWEGFEYFKGRWGYVEHEDDREYRREVWKRKPFSDALITKASKYAPEVVRRVLREVFAEDPSGLEAALKELFAGEETTVSDLEGSSSTSAYHFS